MAGADIDQPHNGGDAVAVPLLAQRVRDLYPGAVLLFEHLAAGFPVQDEGSMSLLASTKDQSIHSRRCR